MIIRYTTLIFTLAILTAFSTLAQNSKELESLKLLDPIASSKDTEENPQSKVWQYAEKWWTVIPDSTGTFVWRLDNTTWTKVLKLTSKPDAKADCKVVGNVVHVLHYRGRSISYLTSLEYDAANSTYKLWSKRPETVSITFDPEVETATLEVDGTGRMWIASDGLDDINVIWSDSPYNTWSAPQIIATGLSNRDLSAIIAMPGKIGVLWSNQKTQMFGFRTHIDGAAPTQWTDDEKPGAQLSVNVGKGFSDDHLNIAIASDGTLYCVIKTSYDTPEYPKIALLVRRPSGKWDKQYKVSESGTRPIVVLNEKAGTVKIVYSSTEGGGDILYQEARTSFISFGTPVELLKGKYNYPTSSKESYGSDFLILATDLSSTSLKVKGILAKDRPPFEDCANGSVGSCITVYPNPFTSRTILSFPVIDDGQYGFSIYDVKGETLDNSIFKPLLSGDLNEVEIDGSRLASGLYFIKLHTKDSIYSKKIILTK